MASTSPPLTMPSESTPSSDLSREQSHSCTDDDGEGGSTADTSTTSGSTRGRLPQRQNIANTPEPQHKKRKTSTAPRYCTECDVQVSSGNWSRHQRTVHGREPGFSGLRERCGICDADIGYKRRNDHYRRHHPDEHIPPPHEAVTFDPVTNERHVFKKRLTIRCSSPTPIDLDDAVGPENAPLHLPDPCSVAQSTPTMNEAAPRGGTTDFDLVTMTRTHTTQDTARMFKSMEKRLAEIQVREPAPKSIHAHRFPQYHRGMQNRRVAQILTADQYDLAIRQQAHLDPDGQYAFVVCTMEEAGVILQKGPPLFSIVVPGATDQLLEVGGSTGILEYLKTKSTIATHDAKLPFDRYTGEPVPCPSADAVARYLDTDTVYPVNFLDLECWKGNPYADCIDRQPRYNILRTLKKTQTSGKQTQIFSSDLTNSSAVHVLAKDGAYSFPHVDRYGMITLVSWEGPGLKGWATWPRLTREEMVAWSRDGGPDGDFPARAYFMIALRPGSLLIQPGGTVHAPWSEGDGLATITEHMDSASINDHIEAAMFEREHTAVSNEGEAYEALVKFQLVLQAWENGNTSWPWASSDELAKYRKNVELFESGFTTFPQSCNCTGRNGSCQSDLCPCAINGNPCNRTCHTKGKGKGKGHVCVNQL